LRIALALGALWMAAAIAAPAQTLTTLLSFNGSNGASPAYIALVQGSDGDLYGTTEGGGSSAACPSGCGTVFKMSLRGTLTTLYNFDFTHGVGPLSGLALGADGNFYGTTSGGGINSNGTVFRITPQGKLSTLHSFSYYVDGSYPYAGLVQGSDGDFYGSTSQGGANGAGALFRITPEGKLTLLHGFAYSDGANAYAALAEGVDGSFYGTTVSGGANGYGTVFKLAKDGTLTTLHSFSGTDGSDSFAALIEAPDGAFYGTTETGGTSGYGTIFKIDSAGLLATLHSFDSTDGAFPTAALALGSDGSFYGTTVNGGSTTCSNGCGTVFKMSRGGTLRTLHSFGLTDGDYPSGSLVQDTNGVFYGTTNAGGASNEGTVFALSVGLGSFVKTMPTSGSVGIAVRILGTDLKGATSVTFGGTSATFKVVSGSLISSTVPVGANTGPVEVVTPTGTLTSNVNFQVLP